MTREFRGGGVKRALSCGTNEPDDPRHCCSTVVSGSFSGAERVLGSGDVNERVRWVLRRAALVSAAALVLWALACEPANATPSGSSPPTTISPGKIAGKTVAAIRPLIIAAVALGALSLL